ncbi:hypothetical protein HAX54_039092, partial [Datura stramonium]|nr:hypothetical protein [Datura stramonium]
ISSSISVVSNQNFKFFPLSSFIVPPPALSHCSCLKNIYFIFKKCDKLAFLPLQQKAEKDFIACLFVPYFLIKIESWRFINRVCATMGARWNTYGIKLSYLALLIIVLDIRGCCSLNSEGLALLRFRVKVDSDPYGILENWNSDHCDPCMWSGVRCMDGKVQML